MKHRLPLVLLGLALLFTTGLSGKKTSPSDVQQDAPPNVIIVFVDDLGWADVGANGSVFYETPHIDRLANEGDAVYERVRRCRHLLAQPALRFRRAATPPASASPTGSAPAFKGMRGSLIRPSPSSWKTARSASSHRAIFLTCRTKKSRSPRCWEKQVTPPRTSVNGILARKTGGRRHKATTRTMAETTSGSRPRTSIRTRTSASRASPTCRRATKANT